MPPYTSDTNRFTTFFFIVVPFLRCFIIRVRDADVCLDLPARRFLAQQAGDIHRLLYLNHIGSIMPHLARKVEDVRVRGLSLRRVEHLTDGCWHGKIRLLVLDEGVLEDLRELGS